jgi:hypothetical protein
MDFESVVSCYRNAGYDFLSITDHWVCSKNEKREDFLLLSGCEYSREYQEKQGSLKRDVVVHINGIGFDAAPKLEAGAARDTQEIIDAINALNGIAVFNHPAWSRNLIGDIQDLKGLAGIEIYNSDVSGNGFQNSYCLGYSGSFIDQLALMGINTPVFATDDGHGYSGDEGQAFIMVQAEALSREAILNGIKERRFYASQGPRVQILCKDRLLKITCSPAVEIQVFSDAQGCWAYRSKQPVTRAEYRLPDGIDWRGKAYYYRVEIIDEKGKRAWTSPEKII